MPKHVTLSDYRNRAIAVVDYIWRNVEGDLDVNVLADVACFSPYHFHRIYRELMHENVAATVRRLRLHRAACDLIRSKESVNSIARKLGYSSTEAFTRTFRRSYELTPLTYRERHTAHTLPGWKSGQPIKSLPKTRTYTMPYTIETKFVPVTTLAGLAHTGDYLDIGPTFEKAFLQAEGLSLLSDKTRSIGIYYDDPWSSDRETLRSHACLTVEQDFEPSEHPLEKLEIGGAQHAVLSFTGPYAELEKAYEWLYGSWLPNSGFDAADAPPFEEYTNDPKTTAPADLHTLIYLPLAS